MRDPRLVIRPVPKKKPVLTPEEIKLIQNKQFEQRGDTPDRGNK